MTETVGARSGARKNGAKGKGVSVCGEMAGEPATAILMMGMGFDVLSMSSSNILRIRKTLNHVPLSDAQRLLQEVLKMDSAPVVKSWLEHYLIKQGLSDMVKSNTPVHG